MAEEEVVKVFDKDEYAGPPGEHIKQMLDKLWVLGKAVTAGRGDGYSSNMVGTMFVGDDGGPVLRGEKPPSGECRCHFHIKWDEIHDYALAAENVGYGPEAVIYLLGADGTVLVRIFYPRRSMAEVAAVLAADPVPRPEPVPSFFYIFKVVFPSEEALQAYVAFWREISETIQKEIGSRGTRLLRIRGPEYAVLALPEWETANARASASQHLNKKMGIDEVVARRIAELGGAVEVVAQADEIASVFP